MSSTVDLSALVARLDAAEVRLDALGRAFARLQARQVSDGDRAMLKRLLPVLGGTFGDAPFLVREVVHHSAAAIQLVLSDLLGLDRDHRARGLGGLLSRACDVPVGGLVVHRIDKREGNARLWVVRQVVGDYPAP